MPKLLIAEVDMASVAQVPSTSLNVALLVIRPSYAILPYFFAFMPDLPR